MRSCHGYATNFGERRSKQADWRRLCLLVRLVARLRSTTESSWPPSLGCVPRDHRRRRGNPSRGPPTIDGYLEHILPQYSLVVERDGTLVAMAFAVVVRGTHYIDPVATASAYKRSGIGAATVSAVLQMLADDDIVDVGAVITEGNVPSERLFSSLGFEQVGVWQRTVQT